MNNKIVVFGLLIIAMLAGVVLGYNFTHRNEDQKNPQQVANIDSIPSGTYYFSEIASAKDPNGITTSAWEHILIINPDMTFSYMVDGRMAMARVKGTVVSGDTGFDFIVKDNPLVDGVEPSPKYTVGAMIFQGAYDKDSKSIDMTWGDQPVANLPEYSTGATFLLKI